MTTPQNPEQLEIKAPPSKPVGFQFDVKQWLGDHMVMAMSYAEQGMHMKLMCIAWQETPPCTLPDDDAEIARWLGIAEAAWTRIHKPKVMKAWKSVPEGEPGAGRWVLEGLQRSFLKQVTVLAARQAAANVRWQKEREAASTSLVTTGESAQLSLLPENEQNKATTPIPTNEDEQKAMIWRIGIQLLEKEHPNGKSRQLIGKWIKSYGEPTVASILAQASVDTKVLQSADRFTYITAMLEKTGKLALRRRGAGRGDHVL